MEGVERTNAAIARLQQQGAGFSQRNPYAMDVNRKENQNCYVCGGFGHLARNGRNREMGMNRRIKVDQDNNLNGEGVKIVDSRLHFYFLFLLYSIFLFLFCLFFLFLEQLGLEFVSHAVTSVTS